MNRIDPLGLFDACNIGCEVVQINPVGGNKAGGGADTLQGEDRELTASKPADGGVSVSEGLTIVDRAAQTAGPMAQIEAAATYGGQVKGWAERLIDDEDAMVDQMTQDGIENVQPSKMAEVLQSAVQEFGFDPGQVTGASRSQEIADRAVETIKQSGTGGAFGKPAPVPEIDRLQLSLGCTNYICVFFKQ